MVFFKLFLLILLIKYFFSVYIEEKDKSNGLNNITFNKQEQNNMSTLEQILDDDFITGQIPNENSSSMKVNNFVSNNDINSNLNNKGK